MIQASITHRIIRHAGDISVHVIAEERAGDLGSAKASEVETTWENTRFELKAYLGSFLMASLALGIGLVLRDAIGISNVALVFLTAVLTSAVTYGLLPSLFTCVVSMLAYNFFFLPPLLTIFIAILENGGCALLLPGCRISPKSSCCAYARPGRNGSFTREDYREPLLIQP